MVFCLAIFDGSRTSLCLSWARSSAYDGTGTQRYESGYCRDDCNNHNWSGGRQVNICKDRKQSQRKMGISLMVMINNLPINPLDINLLPKYYQSRSTFYCTHLNY